MNNLYSAILFALLLFLLSACGSYEDANRNNGTNPDNPPAGAFSMALDTSKLTLSKGDLKGKEITVTLGFDQDYEDAVLLSRNNSTTGLSVLYGGEDLNALELKFEASADIKLTIIAETNAQTLNPYLELVAQGIDSKGRTRGLPRFQKTIDLTIQ